MNTVVTKNEISCSVHGKITGVDCCSLRDGACGGCFIYEATKDIKRDVNEKSVLGKANSDY